MKTVLTGVVLLALAATMPASAADRVVTVTGEATVSVAPDLSIIRLGVTSQGKTAREANDANARQMTAVIAALKATGIGDGDVQTSHLSIQPQYDTSKPGTARLTGFQATNQVTVKIHAIDKLPDILDKAIGAGANEMSGIEFMVTERSKLLDQARSEAMADARRKAAIYAKAADVKVGHVVAITEAGAATAPPIVMRAGGVPIVPGEQTLHAQVTVSYELTQ
jgi:uncharacterized protein